MIEIPLITIFAVGLLLVLIPKKYRMLIKTAALTGAILCLLYGIYNIINPLTLSGSQLFKYNQFSGVIGLLITFFGFIVVCYSISYAEFIERINQYYSFIFWCLCFSIAVVYSSNLVTLTVFWGLSGLMLYLLANITPEGANASKKTFIFIGGSDSFLILGITIIGLLAKSLEIDNIKLNLNNGSVLAMVAFLCLLVAALTKAGAMPFHTWIPDFANNVPLSLTAFLPAALDKLLGIFFLYMICQQLFVLNTGMTVVLLLIGTITVICAVYMAMVQHDMRKLLAYHAVSQVGYMVLGIAIGTPLGILGGLFHMINNAIYKSGLFLTSGAVEHRIGHTNLDRLGGLVKYMPVTFVVFVITALSISGIPPFNGFVSKWIIYQGLLQQISNPDLSGLLKFGYIIFVITVMFGSALTLASFMKLIHSVFLGQPAKEDNNIKEVSFSMWLPMAILAALCLIFGIFANSIPIKYLIGPALNNIIPEYTGVWSSGTATILIIVGLIAGYLIYLLGNMKFRESRNFVCGENEKLGLDTRVTGTDFYNTVTELGFFKTAYKLAEKKVFDIYELLLKLVLGAGDLLSQMHTGNIRTYIAWMLLGIVFLFAVLIK